jgi:hypothetical protein
MELTDQELRTLDALIDRIIPKDDFPSASENGVGNFIRQILKTDLKHRAEEARLGLKSLNDEATVSKNQSFANLSADEQDQLLRIIEFGEDTRAVWPIPPKRFFEWIVQLTNEGYYADPSNGANLDCISWRMIGYEPRLPSEPTAERWLEKKP